MKYVIFSPVSVASAIGKVSERVNRELIQLGHEVVVVSTDQTRVSGSDILHWKSRRDVLQAVNNADIMIYHIGDNYEFHAGALEWMPKAPGVICLHDFSLLGLFLGYRQVNDAARYEVFERWYPDGLIDEIESFPTRKHYFEAASKFPMTGWVCSQGYGVVTHSEWGTDRVLASCPGPVWVVPLPYELDTPAMQQQQSMGGPIKFISTGNVNSNRQIELVIRAIASSEILRRDSSYALAGSTTADYLRDLLSMANALGVRLRIFGKLDDGEFESKVSESDVVICLRDPTLESASASAIEAMLFGKPTVVTNQGFYAELPDNAVVKIEPGPEIEQLRDALERLLVDSEFRGEMGRRAREFAEATFRADRYAAALVEMSSEVLSIQPVLEVERAAFRQFNNWGALNDETFEPVSRALLELGSHPQFGSDA